MTALNRKPLFAQIAERLRKEIERDGYPGLRLQAERALAARFKVSPVTIREALGILREEGRIDRRHGSGSYVCERHPERAGVVLDLDIAEQGFSYFWRSSTQAARRHLMAEGYEAPLYAGVRPAIGDAQEPVTCREFVTDVQAGRLKGIVAIAALPNAAWLKPAQKRRIPVVGAPSAFGVGVAIDQEELLRLGVGQLTAARRRRVAVLAWAPDVEAGTASDDGGATLVERVLRDAGVTCRREWIRTSLHPGLAGAGWEEFREIWAANAEKPDGLLICDDMLFPDAAAAILELGICVPESLMVVTHANRGSRIRYPFPTVTLEIDPEEFGRLLADKLVQVLRQGRADEAVATLVPRVVLQPARQPAGVRGETVRQRDQPG